MCRRKQRGNTRAAELKPCELLLCDAPQRAALGCDSTNCLDIIYKSYGRAVLSGLTKIKRPRRKGSSDLGKTRRGSAHLYCCPAFCLFCSYFFSLRFLKRTQRNHLKLSSGMVPCLKHIKNGFQAEFPTQKCRKSALASDGPHGVKWFEVYFFPLSDTKQRNLIKE